MDIKVQEVVQRPVRLSKDNVDEVTIARLYELLGGKDWYINALTGMLQYDIDYGNNRGGIETVVVREATENDRMVQAVIGLIELSGRERRAKERL